MSNALIQSRHGRACPGHPRLNGHSGLKTWMPGARPGMTSLLASLAILATAFPAHAQSVADFYKGKNITQAISFPPGGGYDLYARILARHMGKHIPGNPTIVPQNMPGAGGLRVAQ